MKINKNIFRAYDIRGTAQATETQAIPDLTPEVAEIIGRSSAAYLIKKDGIKEIYVGRDNRLHSLSLQQAFMKGAAEGGLKVTDVGLATSPMIYYATCKFPGIAGTNITASHNPKQDNGIKLVRENAHCVAGEELQEILKMIEENNLPFVDNALPIAVKGDLFDDYLADVKVRTNIKRKLKVVVDTGNGVAGGFAPALLRSIGVDVIELYTELDGNFPNHEANPEQPKNMVDLGARVVEEGADLGIGIDGDGDRIGLVDESGAFQSIEPPMILLARDLLSKMPGEKIVFDVKISRTLIDEIKKHGGVPVMSRTGHSFIHERLKAEDAPLAGEKSGHMFFSKKYYDYYGFDDAMFAACKILEVISVSEKKYSEHFADLPALINTPEAKAYCPDDRKFAVIDELKKIFVAKYDCITIDGVRVNFDENSWGLIRASNTSPAFTLLFEAPSEARLQEIKGIVYEEIAKFPEVKLPE